MVQAAVPGVGEQLTALLGGDAGIARDPYPLYARMRDEAAVCEVGSQVIVVSRHADVRACYHHSEQFPSPPERIIKYDGRFSLLSEADLSLYHDMVEFERLFISRYNGDEHRRYRGASQRAFTPRQIGSMEAMVQEIVDSLLASAPRDEIVDWMGIAYRVPLLVIMELLGAPREDADVVKSFGDVIAEPNVRTPLEPDVLARSHRSLLEYREYARMLIERNRASDRPSNIVALLLDAGDEDRVTYDELVATFLHLLFAGHETTTNLIGNGLLAVLSDPEQWALVRSEPTLVPSAVEEMLRFESPVQFTGRVAGEDAVVAGVPIPAGKSVVLANGAANRDPSVFENPERFDVMRRPNEHLAFGLARHFCLGAPLARLEARVLFETLIRRFPEISLAIDPGAVEWVPRTTFRGLRELPVRLGVAHED